MRRTPTRTVLLALALLALGYLAGRGCAPQPERSAPSAPPAPVGDAGGAPSAAAPDWTCSMHPQVRLPEPGRCPMCSMDLVQLEPEDGGGPTSRTLALSESAAALAEIETAPVERRLVAREVRMVGKVAYDETRLAYITAWTPGRLDRLFVDYTGVAVREGDHLVEIYSPELYTAQQELLQVLRASSRLEEGSSDVLRRSTEDTARSAREKLRLLGMTERQVEEVVARGRPDERVTLYAPIGGIVVHKNAVDGLYVDEGTRIYTIADLSKVWVLLDAYESDLGWLRYGQDVEFRVEAYPGEPFHGRIAFIDPVLDDRTRTVKVRLNVDGEDGRLKPGMLVSAVASATLTPHGRVVDPSIAGRWMCPMHPEVLSDGRAACPECDMDLVPAAELGFVADASADQRPPLVIPSSAPLLTGERAVVYVRLPDRERPTFEGRTIELGPRAGDWYVVHSGLSEGEEVVVRGGFKLDSELEIRAQPSMMSAEGGAPPPADARGATPGPSAPAALPTPGFFREPLGELLERYLDLQRALADDDDAAAARAADGLVDAFVALPADDLAEDLRADWRVASRPLWNAARAVAGAEGLEARRAAFEPLTRGVLGVLARFGFARDGAPVGVFHCPMALDGAGADWLQTGEAVANPYFGASMLRCGSHVRGIAPGEER